MILIFRSQYGKTVNVSKAYQGQTACKYHYDDDSLEVAMFDQPVDVAATQPPAAAARRACHERVARSTLVDTADGAAVVGISHKHNVHLVNLRSIGVFVPIHAHRVILRDGVVAERVKTMTAGVARSGAQ